MAVGSRVILSKSHVEKHNALTVLLFIAVALAYGCATHTASPKNDAISKEASQERKPEAPHLSQSKQKYSGDVFIGSKGFMGQIQGVEGGTMKVGPPSFRKGSYMSISGSQASMHLDTDQLNSSSCFVALLPLDQKSQTALTEILAARRIPQTKIDEILKHFERISSARNPLGMKNVAVPVDTCASLLLPNSIAELSTGELQQDLTKYSRLSTVFDIRNALLDGRENQKIAVERVIIEQISHSVVYASDPVR